MSRNKNLLSRMRHRLSRLNRGGSTQEDLSAAARRLKAAAACRSPEFDEDISREFEFNQRCTQYKMGCKRFVGSTGLNSTGLRHPGLQATV